MSPQGQGHTSVNILHYWKKAYWNFILTAFEGVCTGINPDNRHLKILQIWFRNTRANNRYRIIGGSERSCTRNIECSCTLNNSCNERNNKKTLYIVKMNPVRQKSWQEVFEDFSILRSAYKSFREDQNKENEICSGMKCVSKAHLPTF